jgi:hypothetical protein
LHQNKQAKLSAKMAIVSEFQISLFELDALESALEVGSDLLFDGAHGLGFDITIPAKVSATPLTFGGRVVGVAIGEFKNCVAAC